MMWVLAEEMSRPACASPKLWETGRLARLAALSSLGLLLAERDSPLDNMLPHVFSFYFGRGQVWEWCTTLWGEDMATPSYAYPYPWEDDGREDPGAPGAVRRVLRGGCFSSNKTKASCTYRGSLEANGFWRGNGFRVVVARVCPRT